jgi:hypothetical protein
MEVVAESVETVRMQVTAVQGDVFVDPSNNSARPINVAIVEQGVVPNLYSVSGTWESDTSTIPTKYWVTFLTPGNLVRNKKYQVFIRLGLLNDEQPILRANGLLEAV